MVEAESGGKINISPANSIYTLLIIVATLFLLFGTVFLAWQSQELFGSWMPISF